MLFRNDKRDAPGPGGAGVRVPLLPLRDIIVFPHMVVPLFVGRQKSIKALEEAMNKQKYILLAAQREAKTNEPSEDDIFHVGTLGTVVQLLRLPDGTVKVLGRGQEARPHPALSGRGGVLPRGRRGDRGGVREDHRGRSADPLGQLHLRELRQAEQEDPARDDHVGGVDRRSGAPGRHHRRPPRDQARGQTGACSRSPTRPSVWRRSSATCGRRSRSWRSKSASAPASRNRWRRRRRSTTSTSRCAPSRRSSARRTSSRTRSKSWRRRSSRRRCRPRPRRRSTKELKKLKMMSPMSAEATVVRNYIDWIISLPWHEYTDDKLDIKEAEKVLEADHYGLEKVKERILEYLAVQSLVGQMKGPILCLVGPPGVGKTSLGKSIARATGRKFVRVSLGGVRDEAEIRGHRRTYIGALPGKIIQCMKKAGSGNPGVLARRGRQDVDRLPRRPVVGAARGARSRAELDLQRSLPRCGLRPFEGDVHHHGQHAGPHSAAAAGSDGDHPHRRVHRPREAQHRQAVPGPEAARGQRPEDGEPRVLRQRHPQHHPPLHQGGRRPEPRARDRIHLPQGRRSRWSRSDRKARVQISGKNLGKYLGPPRFRFGKAEGEHKVGVATGLAWTELGGELLATEVTVMPGKGQAHHHRTTRRRHAGVGAGGAELRALARRRAGTRTGLLPARRHPHPRARRGHSQRTVRPRVSPWRLRWCRR